MEDILPDFGKRSRVYGSKDRKYYHGLDVALRPLKNHERGAAHVLPQTECCVNFEKERDGRIKAWKDWLNRVRLRAVLGDTDADKDIMAAFANDSHGSERQYVKDCV
jgi:hypothetical protein